MREQPEYGGVDLTPRYGLLPEKTDDRFFQIGFDGATHFQFKRGADNAVSGVEITPALGAVVLAPKVPGTESPPR